MSIFLLIFKLNVKLSGLSNQVMVVNNSTDNREVQLTKLTANIPHSDWIHVTRVNSSPARVHAAKLSLIVLNPVNWVIATQFHRPLLAKRNHFVMFSLTTAESQCINK